MVFLGQGSKLGSQGSRQVISEFEPSLQVLIDLVRNFLGTVQVRTWGCRMEKADAFTELRRPNWGNKLYLSEFEANISPTGLYKMLFCQMALRQLGGEDLEGVFSLTRGNLNRSIRQQILRSSKNFQSFSILLSQCTYIFLLHHSFIRYLVSQLVVLAFTYPILIPV